LSIEHPDKDELAFWCQKVNGCDHWITKYAIAPFARLFCSISDMIGGFSKNGQTLEQGQGASNFQQGALVLKILIFPLNFPNTGRIQALILYF